MYEGLNIYRKFCKIVVNAICNFIKINDCSICDSSGNSIIELLRDILYLSMYCLGL